MRVQTIRKVAAVLMVVGLVGLMTGCKSQVRIGTGGAGGTYYAIGGLMGKALSEDYGIDTKVRQTAGSAANLRLLSKGFLQLAMAQADVTEDAYHGTDLYKEKGPLKGYGAVAALYDETVHIVVPASSDIRTPADLEGRKICIGEEESGVRLNAIQILQAYGLSESMITGVELNYQDAAEALKHGEIDGLFCTAGLQTQVLTELAEAFPVRFLSIDEERTKHLMGHYGFYQETQIPAGTYSGQEEPISTLSVKSLLLASDVLSAETVEETLEALFRHKSEWSRDIPALAELDQESVVESVTIPFHPGAAAYYEKNGIQVDSKE